MINIDVFEYSNPGTRDNNEDFCLWNIEPERSGFFVADGLGGHARGEVASRTAVQYLIDHMKDEEVISEAFIDKLIRGANKELMDLQQNKCELRTTIVSCFVENGYFWTRNVGDSRCYYFKNGCIYYQTKDDSLSQLNLSGGKDILVDTRFDSERNQLLKVLGNDENLYLCPMQSPIKIENGDAFLMCTDGFWEYVYETEMELDFLKSQNSREWMEHMVKRILHCPSDEKDNFTALTGQFTVISNTENTALE